MCGAVNEHLIGKSTSWYKSLGAYWINNYEVWSKNNENFETLRVLQIGLPISFALVLHLLLTYIHIYICNLSTQEEKISVWWHWQSCRGFIQFCSTESVFCTGLEE